MCRSVGSHHVFMCLTLETQHQTNVTVLVPLQADLVISMMGPWSHDERQLDTCSGVIVAAPSKTMVHHPAVLRLQTVGDALLHLLAAPQEPAAITSKLLPRAPPVLGTDEDLVHVVAETYLKARPQSTSNAHSRAAAPLKLFININVSFLGLMTSSQTYQHSPGAPSPVTFVHYLPEVVGSLTFRP